MTKHVHRYSCCSCYLLLTAILHGGVLSSPTEKNDNGKITVESLPVISKRQIHFQSSNFNQQAPQDYTEFYQQTNTASIQKPQSEQTGPQQFLPGSQRNTFSPTPRTTTTTLSPFAAEQVRLQTEYKNRALVEQLTNQQQRTSPRTFVQPPYQFQVQSQQQQRQPLQYLDENGRMRQLSVAPQQDAVGLDPQRDVGSTLSDESYSYAQVQFGAVSEPTEPSLLPRPKGQRSVSRPRANQQALEPLVQQTIQNPTTIFPAQFNPRLLQNVVYVQPNGQIHRPVEDAEPVVEIPRRNNHLYGHPSESAFGPETAASGAAPIPATTTAANPVEDDPVILIPRPKKPENPTGRIRQESRKPGRAQQPVKTTKPPPPPPLQQYVQQQAEVEPDNFLTSLLYRLQQQQQPDSEQETTVAPKPRGSQRSKGGDRSDASKYLPDRSQLQLLQFPHELQSLSSAELRALESAGAQIAAADNKFVGQKRLPKNRPVAVSNAAQTSLPPAVQPVRLSADQLFDGERNLRSSAGHRPVPTPVELNDEQRQFLAAQGIRNLYRVDYDQSGNALPLTYVLALDNSPKRAEQRHLATPTNPTDES